MERSVLTDASILHQALRPEYNKEPEMTRKRESRKGSIPGKKVVHPAGLEPTTYCSGGSRSIQMSYGCT